MKDIETELCALPQLLLVGILQTTQASSAHLHSPLLDSMDGTSSHSLEASIFPVIVLSLACQQLLLINKYLFSSLPPLSSSV